MKTKICHFPVFLSAFLACTLCAGDCLCQWEEDVRLTFDAASCYTYNRNNAWSVAAYNNNVHAVWRDSRDGHAEIYYKLSTDYGINWGTDIRLTNATGGRNYACIAVSGSFIHVTWQDSRHGELEIYYKRSTNGGLSWDDDVRLTNEPYVQQSSSIAVSGSTVHVVWEDWRYGVTNSEIYYKRSTDGGITWEPEVRLTYAIEGSLWPSVAVSGSVVHVVWADIRDGGSGEIYYKCSTDGGINWGADTRLRNNPAAVNVASVAASGLFVHVAWADYRNGNGEIYYKRSTDGGINWGEDTRLTSDPGPSEDVNIMASGSSVHIVWMDERDGNKEIYYKCSTDGGINWEEDVRLTYATGKSEFPSAAISDSVVHVLWQDERDGNYEVYYKRNIIGGTTNIGHAGLTVSEGPMLSQNRPNPFERFTVYNLQFTKGENVRLAVYDLESREVAVLVDGYVAAGSHQVRFDAGGLPGGVYFCRLQAGDIIEAKKLIILK